MRLIKHMLPRSFSEDEVRDFLNNKDDPKTLDYYIRHIIDIRTEGGLTYEGHFHVTLQSHDDIKAHALRHIREIRNNKKAHPGKSPPLMFFTMHLFPHQYLPKCRTLGIVTKYALPVNITNPNAGKLTEYSYGPGAAHRYTRAEPPHMMQNKYMVIYRRSAWDRKSELKIKTVQDDENSPSDSPSDESGIVTATSST